MRLLKCSSLLLLALSSVAFAASPCKDGWASLTGTCGPETATQKAIVSRAVAAIGSGSGQSTICSSNAAGCWLTDTEPPPTTPDNDGNLMRKALHNYFVWFTQNPKTRPSLASLQNSIMAPIMSAPGHYTTGDAQKMAAHMTAIACPATDPLNWSNNQVMAFLGIHKQCMEWAVTTATGASPSTTVMRNYNSPAFPVSDRVRPGMGLYNRNTHAMLIIDILWKGGIPVAFQVAEANYPNYPVANPQNVWSADPYGEVPWLREVHARPTSVRDGRGQPLAASAAVTLCGSCFIVNYEK